MISARKPPKSRKRPGRSEWLELRLAPATKRHQRMVLSGADRDAFLAAMTRRPDPAPRLVAALWRHRQLLG
jgi:hypothetical protein